MSVIRVNKTSNYTVMSNTHLRDRSLSLKAKGLMSQMLSLPDDWDYSISGLAAINSEKESCIKSALNELKKSGYLVVTKKMPNETESGRIEYVYDLYEEPKTAPCFDEDDLLQPEIEQDEEKQEVEKQGIENLGVEFLGVEVLAVENQRQLNKEEQNTEERNKEEELPPVIPNGITPPSSFAWLKEVEAEPKKKPNTETALFPDIIRAEIPEVEDLFNKFLDMRKKKYKPLKTVNALNARIKELKKCSDGNVERMRAVIQQSLDNEWLKFIELKTEDEYRRPRRTSYNPFTELKKEEGLI